MLATGNSASPGAPAALTALCETCWSPAHHFIRQTGRSPEHANDLTQASLARVLEEDGFKAARPERGRVRSFLLPAVRVWDAADRGGQVRDSGQEERR